MKWISWKKYIFGKKCISLSAALMGIVLALSVCATTAYAYERIDTDAKTSLTAVFAPQDTGEIEGTDFRLYKVADVSDTAGYTVTKDFAGAGVSLSDVSGAGVWADRAVTLLAYADANGIAADFTGITDANGRVSFSNLTVGLYLLAGDAAVAGDYSYTPTPAVIMLPSLSADDTWDYNPVVDVKVTSNFLTKYQELTVKKEWKDGGRQGRPSDVEIQLLRDGQIQETIILDKDNNWMHTWRELTSTYESEGRTKTYTYTVNEKNVSTGYTVLVNQNGASFTVTNTYKEQTPEPADPTLPQTGTLNWPIPVLVIVGMLLLIPGWYLFTRKKEN